MLLQVGVGATRPYLWIRAFLASGILYLASLLEEFFEAVVF